jgi:bifunctional non-homologous end joining protein LigD
MTLGLHLTHGPTTTRRRDLTLPAGFIAPCLPMMAPRPPSESFWLHEIKYDGVRVIVRKDSRRVRLYDRLGGDLTQRFPLIAEAMAGLPSCTIDGEAVVCDDSGIPSFDLLRRRQRDDRAFLCAFDLIELSGDDRRRDPLEQRKVDLSRLLADAPPGLVLNHWIDGDRVDGAAVFERVCALSLEGIVSKRKDSRYISGRSPYWLKMRNPTSEAARREDQDESATQTLPTAEGPSTARSPIYTSRHEAPQQEFGDRQGDGAALPRACMTFRIHAE